MSILKLFSGERTVETIMGGFARIVEELEAHETAAAQKVSDLEAEREQILYQISHHSQQKYQARIIADKIKALVSA